MSRRWAVLFGLFALVAVGWLLGSPGVLGRASRTPPRAEGGAARGARGTAAGESADGLADPAGGDAADLASLPEPVDPDGADRLRDLHGIVVRKADGAPIAGAEIEVVAYPWRRAGVLNSDGYYDTVDAGRTRSARDGTFSVRLRPGADVALRVRARGHAPVELGARQAGERVRVEMEEGARLTIVTRDDRGAPVPGTRLRLWGGAALPLLGVTDGEGRCPIGTVPTPGAYTVDVVPERLGYHGWETVQLTEPGEREHVVTLVKGRTITGRVYDAETKAPIPGARVGMNWVMRPLVLSDADGRYALPGWIGRGVSDIHCEADEYGRAEWIVDGDVHDFALSRGDSVTGRLLGADGRPVAAAHVSTIGSVDRSDGQQICTRAGISGADGRFLLRGLRRGMPHTLIAMAEGHGRYLLDFDEHPDVPGTIDLGDITLPEARTIAGRVVTHAGEPVPRVEVNLSGFNRDRGRLRNAEPDRSFYGTVESRRTDDLGRFRFPDLSPGAYGIEVRRPGSTGEKRHVRLGEERDLLDLEIVLPDGREFIVTVVDEEGVPVPKVFVSVATDVGGGGFNGQTDALGRVTFFVAGRVARIDAHPFASGRDLVRAEVQVEGDADGFRVVLKRKATIKGRVVDADGLPVGRAWVAAKRDGKQVSSAEAGADGAFSLDVPRGESFDVGILGVTSGGAIDMDEYGGEPVRAEAGATGVEIRVRRLERDRTLRVRVLFPDGSAAAGVFVFVHRVRVETDRDGVAAFVGLPAKETTVLAWKPEDRSDVLWTKPVSVVPAGQDVTLALRAARTVGGTVLMPDGTPAVGAIVEARREGDDARYSAGSDPEGRFAVAVPSDEPGPWTLRARLERRHQGEAQGVRTGDAAVRIQLR